MLKVIVLVSLMLGVFSLVHRTCKFGGTEMKKVDKITCLQKAAGTYHLCGCIFDYNEIQRLLE